MAKRSPIPTKPEGHRIPTQELRHEPVLTLEERIDKWERDTLEAKLVGYCACNYARVICEEMGLRNKVKKIDEDFERLKNGDF
jgi:predicted transcriptional regulator